MTISLRADGSGTYGAMQLNGVDKLLLNADSTLGGVASPLLTDNSFKLATTGFVQGLAGGLSGRNRIINGDFRVAQRGFNGVYTTGVSGYGGPDRFSATNSSSGGQFTQSLGTLVDGSVTKNCITHTVNTVVPDLSTNKIWGGIIQYIEGTNCYDLIGQPVTVSFLFKASVAGTYSVALRDSTPTYSYITTFTVAANTVTKVIVNIPAIPSAAVVPNSNALGMSLWIGAINSATYSTSTLNAWQAGNYICASTSTLWGQTSGATISVADLQLESGIVATQFERRSYAQELVLCQRYYTTVSTSIRVYVSGASQSWSVPVVWPAMRVAPTSAIQVNGGVNNTISNTLVEISTIGGRFEIVSAAAADTYVTGRVYSLIAEL